MAAPTVVGTRSGKSAGHFRLYAPLTEALGPAVTAAACADRTCPASWGEDGPSRAGWPTVTDFPAPGRSCRTRAVCARDGPPPGAAGKRVPGATRARSVRGTQVPCSGVQLQTAAPRRPRQLGCGPHQASSRRARWGRSAVIADSRQPRFMFLAGAQWAPRFLIVVDFPRRSARVAEVWSLRCSEASCR